MKVSPDGSFALSGTEPCERLSGSISVMSSPNTLEIFALLVYCKRKIVILKANMKRLRTYFRMNLESELNS